MLYTAKDTGSCETTALREALETILDGLGLKLIEFTVSRQKGSTQVRAVIYNGASIGVDDCSRAYRAILPRLELAFEGTDVYLEVSSPGIDRLIKDVREFAHYIGRGIRCYRTDISDWSSGILESVDEKGIVLKQVQLTKGKEGYINMEYEVIAKAKLDSSEEV